MLHRLSLTNFRLHAHTELRFDPNRQLVLLSGRNGSGKTTLLEAVVYALYGESRHGRRGLAGMLRHGAELDGMQVELDFEVGGTHYEVARRYDGKSSSALLSANGVEIVHGANPVSEQVAQIFGLDAAGFRLAVIAQQKQLEGLGALQPGQRSDMLARMLGVHAVDAARGLARRRQRETAAAAQALDHIDVDEAAARLEEATRAQKAAADAHEAAAAVVADLDRRLADLTGVAEQWEQAQRAEAHAAGVLAAARTAWAGRRADLARIVVGDEPDCDAARIETFAAIAAERSEDLATGQRHNQLVAHADKVAARIDEVDRELDALERQMDEVAGGADDPRERLRAAIAEQDRLWGEAEQEIEQAHTRQRAAEAAAGRAASEWERAEAARQQAESLEAVCERCGQKVDAAHAEAQVAAALADKTAAADRRHLASAEASQASEARDRAQARRGEARAEGDRARGRLAEFERLEVAQDGLTVQRTKLAAELAGLPRVAVDMAALTSARDAALAELERQRQLAAEHERWVERARRRDEATSDLEQATAALADAYEWAHRSRPDLRLREAWATYRQLRTARQAEADAAHAASAEAAAAAERTAAAQEAHATAAASRERRTRLAAQAHVAGDAGWLLGRTSSALTERIRPALAETTTALLGQMAPGRFDHVQFTADYGITVGDRGRNVDLGQLSGGETDLVALAVRLALAEVVAESRGANRAGFLILDECFSSQDTGRREQVLSALRNLRDSYGQIFMVFHIPGLEDAADLVVEMELDEATGDAVARTV